MSEMTSGRIANNMTVMVGFYCYLLTCSQFVRAEGQARRPNPRASQNARGNYRLLIRASSMLLRFLVKWSVCGGAVVTVMQALKFAFEDAD